MQSRFLRALLLFFICILTIMPLLCALCEGAPDLSKTSDIPEDEAPTKVVYLTFDDGPSPKTPALLDILESEGIKATFFLIGASVDSFPEHTRAIVEAGHSIGNHTYQHSRKLFDTERSFLKDVVRFDQAIERALGDPIKVRLFRFPYGSTWVTKKTRKFIMSNSYLWIDWNALNYDTDREIGQDTQRMLQTAITTSGSKNEIVILLHDNKSRTIEMLPKLIQHYRENGYTFNLLTPELDHMIPGVHMGFPNGDMQ